MKSFTLWLGQSAGDLDRAKPVDLIARTAAAAVTESHRRWASRPDVAGPAHLWVFENTGGRLIYELTMGPSC